MPAISTLQKLAHQTAVEKGWWEGNNHNIPEKLMLIVSEISEALEEYRNGKPCSFIYIDDFRPDELNNKPEGFPIELADAVIRIMDLCGYLNIDLEAAITQKMDYNATRPYRHGGKKA